MMIRRETTAQIFPALSTVVLADPTFLKLREAQGYGASDESTVRDGLFLAPVQDFRGDLLAECQHLAPCVLVVGKARFKLLASHPKSDILSLSGSLRIVLAVDNIEDSELADLLMMGCWGMISNSMQPQEWTAVLKTVAAGEVFAPSRVFTRLLRQLIFRERLGRLSPREGEVLTLIAAEKTNRDIAVDLEISEETLRWHLRNLYSKTGLSGRSEMIAYAKEQLSLKSLKISYSPAELVPR